MNLSAIQILPFKLHTFLRITWVSQSARRVWEPRFNRVRMALRETADAAVAADAYSMRMDRIYYHEVKPLRQQVTGLGLDLLRVDRPAREMSEFFPIPFEPDDKRAFILVGRKEAIRAAEDTLDARDFDAFHQSFGLPGCCVRFLREVKHSQLTDTTWPMSARCAAQIPASEYEIDQQGNAATNRLLACLGLTLLRHTPCCHSCQRSIECAEEVAFTSRKVGFKKEMRWLRECLAWPCSWSALHGIAEVKTPLFKVIYNTDTTAERLSIRQSGSVIPEQFERGITFPYAP